MCQVITGLCLSLQQIQHSALWLQATHTVSCSATQDSSDGHPSVRDRFMSALMACAAAASVTLAFPASSAFAEPQPFLSSTGVLPQLAFYELPLRTLSLPSQATAPLHKILKGLLFCMSCWVGWDPLAAIRATSTYLQVTVCTA